MARMTAPAIMISAASSRPVVSLIPVTYVSFFGTGPISYVDACGLPIQSQFQPFKAPLLQKHLPGVRPPSARTDPQSHSAR